MSLIRKLRQQMAQCSLLARLILFVSIFFIFVWSLTARHTYKDASEQTKTFFDMQMILLAKNISDLDFKNQDENKIEFEEKWSDRGRKLRDYIDNNMYSYAVFSEDGKLLYNVGKESMNFPFKHTTGFVHEQIQGLDWRIFWYPNAEGQNSIAIGYERDLRRDVRFTLLISHMLPWIVFLVVFLVGFVFLLKHELKPLHCVVDKLKKRKPQDATPLEVTGLTTEMRPLVESLNALFKRTTALLERERSFVANAAHELRTPLSGLRLQVEVLERKIDDPAARQNALKKILDGSSRCTRLVDQLLLLSSLESKVAVAQEVQAEIVPWNALLQGAEEDILDAAIAKDITIEFSATSPVIVSHGSSEFWSIVLRNMLDNAVRYTPKGGIVRAVLQEESLYVENSAVHLSSETLEHLGQRFYRPPGQQERGSGLGLAIMRHIAALHHTIIRMENIKMRDHAHAKIQGIRTSVKFK